MKLGLCLPDHFMSLGTSKFEEKMAGNRMIIYGVKDIKEGESAKMPSRYCIVLMQYRLGKALLIAALLPITTNATA